MKNEHNTQQENINLLGKLDHKVEHTGKHWVVRIYESKTEAFGESLNAAIQLALSLHFCA